MPGMLTDGGIEDSDRYRTDGGWPSDTRTAGKWSMWCADCGSKVHRNASECPRCGAGSDGRMFGVKYWGNVGKPEYTSDGEDGVYERELHTEESP